LRKWRCCCRNGDKKKNPKANYQAFDLTENFTSDTVSKLSYLEKNYKDNYLQALNDIKTKNFEIETFDLLEKVVMFENLRTTVSLGDAENLPVDLYPDNNYDVVFSNFVLHLVETPEKMLQQAYRVLAPGGRAAFTVWGTRENSEFFTVPKKNMKKFEKFRLMVENSTTRSPFHLNDRNAVLDAMEQVGFKGCHSIDLFTFFDFTVENQEE